MRNHLVGLACSLVALVACGGATQKPASSEADTSSLEAPSGGGAASSSSDSSPAGGAAPAKTADAAPAKDAAPAADAPAAAPLHPVPGATGSIDGQPFTPKVAQISGAVQKDGRALVVIHEGSDCTAAPDAAISLMVPWKDGYKTDLASLKRAKGASVNEAAFVRTKKVSTAFKPTGLVTVVSAPTQKGAVGKMKIDLQSGDYMLAGDLDVVVCGK
ncbi:MAG TPA: hypothetical protein VGG39_14070 [Polyangiaceae bacterium]|jgi:hypothetical protein